MNWNSVETSIEDEPQCKRDTTQSLLAIHDVYTRASNPSERFADLFAAVDAVFAPLSAADSRSLAKAFGIAVPCRSKRAAIVAVRKRVEGRLESAQRCQF